MIAAKSAGDCPVLTDVMMTFWLGQMMNHTLNHMIDPIKAPRPIHWPQVVVKRSLRGRPFSDLLTTVWGQWIGLGALMGSIMWFNVWFIIWPSQKVIITSVKTGQSPADLAAITRRAFLASRLNTYLSVPLLFCMGAASHFPSFGWVTFLIMAVVSVVLTWHLIEKVAPKVGSNF